MKMMKILQMPAYFLPNKGGIEYCVYYLAAEFLKAGNRVTVVTSGSHSVQNEIDGIVVKRVFSWQLLKSPVSLRLFFQLFAEKPDVIHLHYPHPFWMDIGALYALVRGIPYVVHSHGNEITLPGWKNIFAQLYNALFFNFVLRGSAAIITNTQKVIPQSRLLRKYAQSNASDTEVISPTMNIGTVRASDGPMPPSIIRDTFWFVSIDSPKSNRAIWHR